MATTVLHRASQPQIQRPHVFKKVSVCLHRSHDNRPSHLPQTISSTGASRGPDSHELTAEFSDVSGTGIQTEMDRREDGQVRGSSHWPHPLNIPPNPRMTPSWEKAQRQVFLQKENLFKEPKKILLFPGLVGRPSHCPSPLTAPPTTDPPAIRVQSVQLCRERIQGMTSLSIGLT